MTFFIKCNFYIILLCCCFRIALCNNDVREIIKSADPLNTAGKWGSASYCPQGTNVIGYNIKHQEFQGDKKGIGDFLVGLFSLGVSLHAKYNDDNGLTGVELICAKNWTSGAQNKTVIRSKFSKHGVWITEKYCPNNFAKGFQVKMQQKQSIGDDSGITNFNLVCDGDDLSLKPHTLSYEPGNWENEVKKCPGKTVLCGLKTKVEDDHDHDDSGLNALVGYCCHVNIVNP